MPAASNGRGDHDTFGKDVMTVSNDPLKYKKRTHLGLKTQTKPVAKWPAKSHRDAMIMAFVAAGPRAHLDLRTLTKKEPRFPSHGGNMKK